MTARSHHSLCLDEPDHEDQYAPLSYHGARRIVWLVFFLFAVWLILRALEPIILLFALVLLLAMVLNPIVVWLQKHHVPRFISVILLMLALFAVTTTIINPLRDPASDQTKPGTGAKCTKRLAGHSGSHRIAHKKLSRSSRGLAAHG